MSPTDLPFEDMLLQINEEAGELVQASAKLLRILRGVNESPVGFDAGFNSLLEEMADVELAIDTFLEARPLLQTPIDEMKKEKYRRWVDRLADK